METFILVLGLFAAIVTTIAFLPQTIRTIKTKDTKSLSLYSYILFAVGLISWLTYGILKSDLPIILANAVSLLLVLTVLVLKLRHG